MSRYLTNRLGAAALFAIFFALYALTAQRGLGWGDSGEFQHWALHDVDVFSQSGFSNTHPLYVVIARAVAHTPFQVTLISAFFGALAVAAFYLCAKNLAMAVLFGLSHCAWWMSCVAEVYTMSLTFIALETYCLLRFWDDRRDWWLVPLALVAGLHLELHNIALLALPVYAAAALARRARWQALLAAAAAFCATAAYWIFAFFTRGPADVLYGNYGSQAMGLLPGNWKIAAFNWALGGLTLAMPAVIFAAGWLMRKKSPEAATADPPALPWPVKALLAIHFLFWVRYFIISQFTFVLPSAFFAYLLASRMRLGAKWSITAIAAQLVLPVAAFATLSSIGFPEWYWRHPHRDDAAYFALPWKFNDDSADLCAAEQGGVWTGYAKETPAK